MQKLGVGDDGALSEAQFRGGCFHPAAFGGSACAGKGEGCVGDVSGRDAGQQF